jgi:DNA-binding NarL/FixJ family response regulator
MNRALNQTAFLCVAIYFLYDVVGDIFEGESPLHYASEAFIFLIAFVMAAQMYLSNKRNEQQLQQHAEELASLKGDLADRVTQQLKVWSLSKAESEVAWLIIKGFSFFEIATLRNVTEKTVRKQATSIYKKANTANRAEFTAEFLSELIIPAK